MECDNLGPQHTVGETLTHLIVAQSVDQHPLCKRMSDTLQSTGQESAVNTPLLSLSTWVSVD